jgi:hypothetical protein
MGVSLFSRDPRSDQPPSSAPEANVGAHGAPGPLHPRDVEGMAVGLALTHDLPIEVARERIQAALARGERRLDVP